MITLERNSDNTRFSVVVNDKLLVSTSSLDYALRVYEQAKNNDLTFAERTFVPFTAQDPKTLTI